MSVNWADLIQKLRSYPAETHTLRPPCSESRITDVERQLGKLPTELTAMLKHFNGARLFNVGAGGEMVTLFGISEEPPLPALEWAVDWYIDKFTPAWRAAGSARQDQWAVAMMNYGELILLDEKEMARKWDISQRAWNPETLPFAQWIDDLLREGLSERGVESPHNENCRG